MGNINKYKTVILGLISLALLSATLLLSFDQDIYFGLVLLVLVLFLFAIKPSFGLYALVFFLPVIHWNFYFGSLEIPFVDLLGIAVLAAFIIRLVYALFFDRDYIRQIKLPVLLPYLLFLGACIASSLFSGDPKNSLWYVARWILLFYTVYVFLPVNIIKNEKILKNTLIASGLSALAAAGMGLYSMLLQDWQSGFIRIKNIMIAGIYPLGENQNLLAEVLLPGIFFLLALKYFYNSGRSQRLINIGIIFISAVLIGTFSRGGWIVLAVCTILYLLGTHGYKARNYLVPLFIVIILLVPIFYYMFALQSDFQTGVGSNLSREAMNQIAWGAWRDHLWLGQGTGEFENMTADNIRFRARFGDPLDSHGVWQKVLAENGLFGTVAFLFLSAWIFITIFDCIRYNKDKRRLLLPVALGAASVFLFEFFNTSYYKGKMWLPIAIALAAVNIINKNSRQEGKK